MRFAQRPITRGTTTEEGVLRIAVPPTLAAAPAAAAHELGLFEDHGLDVRLCREPGWASTREKLLQREVDAAIGPAAFLYSLYHGIGLVRQPCLTALLLPCGGCAITLASSLRQNGLSTPDGLRDLIRSGHLQRRLTFGVAPAPGAEAEFLESWLRSLGIDPAHDVRLVSLPPALVLEHLRRGLIDGFCQAEPWSSAAETAGLGLTAARQAPATLRDTPPPIPTTSRPTFDHALLVLREFVERRPEDHLRLVAALIEGTRFCATPGNLPRVAQWLSLPRYCGVDTTAITHALALALRAPGHNPLSADPMAPTTVNGRRILDGPSASPTAGRTPADRIRRVFRNDLYERAKALTRPSAMTSGPSPTTESPADHAHGGGSGSSRHRPAPGFLLPCLAGAATALGASPVSTC